MTLSVLQYRRSSNNKENSPIPIHYTDYSPHDCNNDYYRFQNWLNTAKNGISVSLPIIDSKLCEEYSNYIYTT